MSDTFAIKFINSNEKVLPDSEPQFSVERGVMLLNQTHHFQVAYNCTNFPRGINLANIKIESELAPYIESFVAELAPSVFHAGEDDDYYITDKTALIPDPLVPIPSRGIPAPYGKWRAVWFRVTLPQGFSAGQYPITVIVHDYDKNELAKATYNLEVLNAVAPKTDFFATNWVHYDCISQVHGVKLFSKKFYDIFARYLSEYAKTGFNALLTPIFTPALDTHVGEERQTAQLVDIIVNDGKYEFNFTKLKKFIRFALAHDIKYIELAHLFTQWGGRFCPKIMATVNGEYKRIFGWDVASDDERYVGFLNEFLPSLVSFIKANGWEKITYFHLTDEPGEDHIPAYTKCRELVKKHIGDMPTMDAMSHYEFYERGLMDIPVPTIRSYEAFEGKDVYPLFVYNCCSPTDKYYSNRFIDMPYQRTRVLGLQMYQTEVQGYLHWGYNFYRTFLSQNLINPYAITDAGGAYPGGDGFIVYPHGDGVTPSVRGCAIAEGFQDYDTMVALEKAIGKDETMRLLAEFGVNKYTEYPRDGKAHAEFMEKVMRLLAKEQK